MLPLKEFFIADCICLTGEKSLPIFCMSCYKVHIKEFMSLCPFKVITQHLYWIYIWTFTRPLKSFYVSHLRHFEANMLLCFGFVVLSNVVSSPRPEVKPLRYGHHVWLMLLFLMLCWLYARCNVMMHTLKIFHFCPAAKQCSKVLSLVKIIVAQ